VRNRVSVEATDSICDFRRFLPVPGGNSAESNDVGCAAKWHANGTTNGDFLRRSQWRIGIAAAAAEPLAGPPGSQAMPTGPRLSDDATRR